MCDNVNVVYRVCDSPLLIPEVVEILKNLEREKCSLPPVKPKGGEIFLFSPPTSSQRG